MRNFTQDIMNYSGIVLRATKNKKLETWYFSLTDGRRVGKDFFLYKDDLRPMSEAIENMDVQETNLAA